MREALLPLLVGAALAFGLVVVVAISQIAEAHARRRDRRDAEAWR